MGTKITMKEMVRAILFKATDGKRTAKNFAEGMYLVDTIPTCFYRWYIEKVWTDVVNGKYSARVAMINFSDNLSKRMDAKGRRAASIINSFLYD